MASNIGVYLIVLSLLATGIAVQLIPGLRPIAFLGPAIILNVISQIFWSYFVYPIFLSPLRHIPGPKNGNILFGHALQARVTQPRGEAPRRWMEEIPNDGLLRFRDMFNREGLIPTSHVMLKAVLVDNSYDYTKQSKSVDILRPVLGDGLVLVEGDVHKFQRKHLQPSFQGHVIRNLYPLFWNKACEVTDMLNQHANEHELEIGDWNTRATLDIIGVAGLGRDFSTLKDPEGEIVQDYNALTEITPEKAFFFVLNIIFPVWLVGRIPFWRIPREAEKIARSLYTFAFDLARERRADLAQLEAKPSQHTQNDILTLLIKSNDFTDDELAHQMLTMMAAGHETTANTLSWCIYLLAQHPEIQNRLREEIRSALPSPSQHSSTSASTTVIDDLPLLNAVCNETFRLYPVVPITSRQAVRETTLGPYKIPVGTNIYIVPWAVNRSTRFWGEDAMVFTPNRWIDADPITGKEKIKISGGASGAFSLLTFLHGPRSCIGQGFARSELKHLLAAMVGRFQFSLSRDSDTYYHGGFVTARPAKGMWVRLKKVEGW